MVKSKYQKQYYLDNKVEIDKYQKQYRKQYDRRQYYLDNKEKLINAGKQWRIDNPGKGMEYHLKRRYGITLEQYNEMLVNQNFKCMVCGKHISELKRALAVDHNHDTKEIRGLLCGKCNLAIGLLEEDPELIKKVLNYVLINQTQIKNYGK